MNIGIDIGRSFVKVAYEEQLLSFPHIIGEGREIEKSKHIKPIDNLQVIHENKLYFVGKLAMESYLPITTFQKSHICDNTVILLKAALSLTKASYCNIAVGLPFADYIKQRKELKEYLQRYADKVTVFPQCAAGIYGQYLRNGRQTKEFPAKVAGIDIGFKDFNFCVLENGELNNKLSWSYPEGLHSAFMAYLPQTNDETINTVDPSDVPKEYYDALKAKIRNLITPYWKNWDFPIYDLGGGAYHVSFGQRVNNPEYANAIGLREVACLVQNEY